MTYHRRILTRERDGTLLQKLLLSGGRFLTGKYSDLELGNLLQKLGDLLVAFEKQLLQCANWKEQDVLTTAEKEKR